MNSQENLTIWTSESDAYAKRNVSQTQERPWITSTVLQVLQEAGISVGSVLDVGCSHGHNLAAVASHFGCPGTGIEPGTEVLREGAALFPNLTFRQAFANNLPFRDEEFELVLVTGVLTWVPRNLYLQSLGEVLRTSSKYVLYGDFCPSSPYSARYKHIESEDLRTWKFDFEPLLREIPTIKILSVSTGALHHHGVVSPDQEQPGDWNRFKFVLLEKLPLDESIPVKGEADFTAAN